MNKIPWVHFKLATVTHMDIILLNGQVMHITYRKIYKCHGFYSPVIIPEGEPVCPAKFMNQMIKISYWYHEPNKAIPVMVKLKPVVMPLIELIQYNDTTNKLSLRYKGYADMNPRLLSVQDYQVILE